MGMILDDPDEIVGMDMRTYYKNRIENDRILINQIDRAIAALSSRIQSSEGVGEYTIDTGQDRQTVKQSDIPYLTTWRKSLIDDMNALIRALNGNNDWRQIVPGF